MTTSLTIPRTLANKLLSLAQLAPETEICGLISKADGDKYRVYPVENIATDKSHVFEMQPQQQIGAFKSMRDQQENLFAIFHTHPHCEAIPSAKDMQDAAYNDALNIIISLSTRGVLDMRGYFYKNEHFEPVDLVIE